MSPKTVQALVLTLALAGCAGSPPVRLTRTPPDAPARVGLRSTGYLKPPGGGNLFDPSVVAVDPRGRVLVADRARGTIFIYDDDGPPRGWLPEPAASGFGGGGRFQDIRAIVTTTGLTAYVLDAGSGRVYSYDLSDQFRGTVLNLGRSAIVGRFGRIRASSLTLDRTAQPVIADLEGDRLLVFDPQWEPSHEIGGPGSMSGAFRDPVALAVTPSGELFVADRGNRRVQVFNPVGVFLEEIALNHPPESIAADRRGHVFVGDVAGVVTILSAGGVVDVVSPPARGAGPAYVAAAPDGRHLYVSRPALGLVEKLEVVPAGASP